MFVYIVDIQRGEYLAANQHKSSAKAKNLPNDTNRHKNALEKLKKRLIRLVELLKAAKET